MSLLSLKIVAPPTTEPVTLAEAKAWLRIDADNTTDDPLVLSLITACRERAEDFTGRSLMTQQWSYSIDCFPCYVGSVMPGRNAWGSMNYWYDSQAIYLPRGPLISVDAITFIAVDGSTNTLDPSQYIVDAASEPARILPAINSYWPTLFIGVPNSINVFFTAGDTSCPEILKLAIKLMCAAFYENSSDFYLGSGTAVTIPLAAQRLMAAHRIGPWDYSSR